MTALEQQRDRARLAVGEELKSFLYHPSSEVLFALLEIPALNETLLALLLSRVSRGGAVYRFLIYFPVLVPGVVAGLIWLFLTNPDFGLLDNLLRGVGAKPVTWLGASTALPTLAAVDVWRNTGYWAIFFVAALIGLPQELYQAASLDGAGAFARFRFLTLPLELAGAMLGALSVLQLLVERLQRGRFGRDAAR